MYMWTMLIGLAFLTYVIGCVPVREEKSDSGK